MKNKLLSKLLCIAGLSVVLSGAFGLSTVYAGTTSLVSINTTNFPDDNFRNYVSENFDTNSDGKLSQTEILGVNEISCAYMGITSLKGVGYFKNVEILSCQANELSELDLNP